MTLTREENKMTETKRRKIAQMRIQGKGYKKISEELGIPLNTVKSWCRRHPCEEFNDGEFCRQCGKPLVQTPHKKKRIFCSDECRLKWWTLHPQDKTHKTFYTKSCPYCNKEFQSLRKNAIYCSHTCYSNARKKRVS